ncbi:MAG: HAMP domain-containing protein [Verrucomicrobia bacterium]|nr:HAMP domain-containing protein [Verrucomicrobiota bacterium]
MKSWTIAQRLYIFFGIVIVALGAGFWLFLHSDNLESEAVQRREQMGDATDRIRYDILTMSDALRGLLIDPKNQTEQQRKNDADDDLAKTMEEVKQTLQARPELLRAIETVAQYDEQNLNKRENELMALVARGDPGALAFYTSTYLPARKEMDKLVGRFHTLGEAELTTQTEEARRERRMALGFFGLIFLATLIGLFYFARSLSRPVEQLNAAVTILAAGDLSAPLPERADHDEIGQLTRSFARLVASLRSFSEAANRVAAGDLTAEFKPQSERDVMGTALQEMGRKLAALVSDVQRSSVTVSSAITEVAATAKQQQATANEVAATTTEIGATSKEITATSKDLAKTVQHVSESAQQAAVLADNGRESIGKMDETMRRVSDAAGGINSRLTVLNDKAANIGLVVTTIAKVADQTNLLSLNAAIEAEKAGEYGRGFAVVATEIRRLADQTATATVDIEQLVKEIQSAVTAGVMGMDKFSEEVRRGVSEVEKVAGQLAQIIQNVQSITPRISAVSEGMQAQSTGAEQISQALVQLGEAARQTAESLVQSNETVHRLDETARGLRTGIERFKLKSN